MHDDRPGLNPDRLVRLTQEAIQRCNLTLHQATVLTEAATGAYIVTPILAAMAGAEKVFALARDSRYGTAEQVKIQTQHLAKLAGVGQCIEFIHEKSPAVVGKADIVTNSGHVRPIDTNIISWMKPNSVIGLMYEAWEFRPEDIDLAACRQHDIRVVGVNERHPAIDVFSFLGIMAVKLLLDAGISVHTSRILLLCDNPFRSYIEHGLVNAGASVNVVDDLMVAPFDQSYDAILVALQPRSEPVLSTTDAAWLAKHGVGTVVVQYWGDIDRAAFVAHHIPVYPEVGPKLGHMGVLPSAVGPEPIIRLQTGGLKAAEVIWRQTFNSADPSLMEFVQLL